MPKSYSHLTQSQPCQIYTLKSKKFSQAEIAEIVGVHPSTISREIARNTGERGYRYKQAHETAVVRRQQASAQPKVMTVENIELIEKYLLMKWSPEQISGRLKKDKVCSISHETI